MMNQPGDAGANRPTAERAADLGEQVGRLASLALQRIEAMASAVASGQAPLVNAEAPDPGGPPEASEPADGSATRRAEQLLDGAAERAKQIAPVVGLSIRRFAALAREEAEDIWAEAQEIRRSSSRGSE